MGRQWHQLDHTQIICTSLQTDNNVNTSPSGFCRLDALPAAQPTALTTIQQQQRFYGPLSRTTRVSRYQKKHSPTRHPDHHPVFISFFHLPRSIASSLFKLCAWQSFCTTSFHVIFRLSLGLEPSTSYSIHFFTRSVSSFHSTCPYHRNLFCCSINMSPIPILSPNSLLGTLSFSLTLHIHLTILISTR